jgi:hypothetical protein
MSNSGNSSVQRLIPIALVLIVIVVAVAALFSLGRSIFGGGTATPIVDTGEQSLLNTSIDRSVRMTVRGPIVGDENFHSYTITATPTMRNLTTYEGYLDRQVDTTQLANSSKAYEQFVHALDRANITNGVELEGDDADMRGVCATGRVYEYEILQASNVIKKFWTTTCRNAKGSLKAPSTPLTNLFRVQIPNASKMTSKVGLS